MANTRQRRTKEERNKILDEQAKEGLSNEQIATKYGVSESTVNQWHTKRQKEDKEKKYNKESISDDSIVEVTKKKLASVDDELKEFDAKVEEYKEFIENATEERQFIEASKEKYQAIIDMLSNDK